MEYNPQLQLKLLVTRGKEQGYLTLSEVSDHLPENIIDSDQLNNIIQMMNDMGIQIMEEAPDSDDFLLTENCTTNNDEEDATEAAVQALSNVDSDLGRTTDPVRMYMREMGTVELLTREGEIDIAKRIEEGINQVQCSVAEYPEAITYLLDQYRRVEMGETRLSDLITGFVDINIDQNISLTDSNNTNLHRQISPSNFTTNNNTTTTNITDEEDNADNEDDNNIDPELARKKFIDLRNQYEITRNTIKYNGRDHIKSVEEIIKLSEVFKQFRLVPKQFDHLVNNMRSMMERIRFQERLIMKLCVDISKMPKKSFIALFSGNETNQTWFYTALSMNTSWAKKLYKVNESVQQSVWQLHQIEKELV